MLESKIWAPYLCTKKISSFLKIFRTIWYFQRQKHARPKNDIKIVESHLLSKLWCNTQTSNLKFLYNEKGLEQYKLFIIYRADSKLHVGIFVELSLFFKFKIN